MARPQAEFAPKPSANTVDAADVARFSRIADEWWDEQGKFAPLHRLNPTRLQYLRAQITAHFKLSNSEKPLKTAPFNGLHMLDIGCGGGLVSEPLTRLGAQMTGIDASSENIAIAQSHAQKMGLEIDYQAMPPEELAQSSKQYDVVLALEVIEHVADVTLFYQMLSRLLKPGGLLILSTLNRTLTSYATAIIGAEYLLRWLPTSTHQWSQFIKPSEMAHGLKAEGFTIQNRCGISYHPLKRTFHLNPRDLKVNYLLSATK
jgi:2-polyprenyl-6-hydroxyphenyl methylase/3-demethylubiquinone-9 3-methyltransferase